MSDSVSGSIGDSVTGAAQHVAVALAGGARADGGRVRSGLRLGEAEGGELAAGCQVAHVNAGVGEVRAVIRAQPITAALIVFTLGYLFGRLGALIPTGGTTRRI